MRTPKKDPTNEELRMHLDQALAEMRAASKSAKAEAERALALETQLDEVRAELARYHELGTPERAVAALNAITQILKP